jgi:hypothetical protein
MTKMWTVTLATRYADFYSSVCTKDYEVVADNMNEAVRRAKRLGSGVVVRAKLIATESQRGD